VIALVVLVVVATLYAAGQAWLNRNQGGDTTCPHFLGMSPAKRADVIDTMGYDPAYITREQQVERAVSECTRARHTSDEDDTIDMILGP